MNIFIDTKYRFFYLAKYIRHSSKWMRVRHYQSGFQLLANVVTGHFSTALVHPWTFRPLYVFGVSYLFKYSNNYSCHSVRTSCWIKRLHTYTYLPGGKTSWGKKVQGANWWRGKTSI